MSSTFLFLCFLLCLGLNTSQADPAYIGHSCSNKTTFTPNSVYQSNLKHLLSVLSSNATHESYNATVGNDPSTTVYGLFFCRGDMDASACRDCVQYAVEDAVRWCPVQKETVIWYDECQLRYSYRSFFGIEAEDPAVLLLNKENITNHVQLGRFKPVLEESLKRLVASAAKGRPGEKKFATIEPNLTAPNFTVLTPYSLGQCTPDLSSENCSRCLNSAIAFLNGCCFGKKGARILFPSCHVRYELYNFYKQIASGPPPSTVVPSQPSGSITNPKEKSKSSSVKIVAIVVPIFFCLILLSLGYCLYKRKAKKKYNDVDQSQKNVDQSQKNVDQNVADNITTTESSQFDLATIEAATNKFSDDNKLGKGGFGEVYKGTLPNGQEIAVKRLSKSSEQGVIQFKNEVELIAKLQHINLVRLFGFCLEGEEKILVYEYVANKSLDYFLFDSKKQGQLNWSIRCNIIEGIARGILYLHEDSRLKIIHRDLKASNILLDSKMIPKVSDFGLAKIFGADQTQGNTIRIIGTYGYMAPEYAMEGLYSVKSDIFSFGVLLFEILSGRKNSGFHLKDCAPSLIAYVWQLWNEEKCLDLMDLCLKDSCDPKEFMRYVHIGLLCVQEDAYKRPTMSSVSLMLKSEAPLPQPDRPAFFASGFSGQHGILSFPSSTANEMTASELVPR
ncbi:hypothetical protein UlMin_008468 [Ulmus minor]